jgi:protein-S-isoprenylcysteine O-methyltransferase Ste14
MDKKRLRHLIEWIATKMGVIWSFIGIIAGVLYPMLYIPLLLSSSWILFAGVDTHSWANTYLKIQISDPRVKLSIYIVEGIIFFTGLVLFCLGLGYLVNGRYRKQKLVIKGPYKFIRHPQNLGILLMCLPFTLYSTNLFDPGIRFGDVMSWILMVTLMCISALIEEKLLISKIGEDYLAYRRNTGFYLPKIRKKSGKGDFTLWKSVLFVLGLYACIVFVCFGIQQLLLKYGFVEYMGMW